MTVGALVLMAVDRQSTPGEAVSLSAPFSLDKYVKLIPIQRIVMDTIASPRNKWDHIQVFYSGTATGEDDKILLKHSDTNGVQFHFLVRNGIPERKDGEIAHTTKWQQQQSCLRGADSTIRICIVSDGIVSTPTDSQKLRAQGLVQFFIRQFGIPAKNVSYPADWQM